MKKQIAWLPVLLWMGVIFVMSAMPGETSSEQSGTIVKLLSAVYGFLTGSAALPQRAIDLLGLLVRKAAHMGEYAVLAMLSARAFRRSGAKRPLLSALLLSAAYAASDEFHQAFVPERGPSPVDVAIDCAGAAIGLCCVRLYACVRRIRKKSK